MSSGKRQRNMPSSNDEPLTIKIPDLTCTEERIRGIQKTLPDRWVVVKDPTTGECIYHNIWSKETSSLHPLYIARETPKSYAEFLKDIWKKVGGRKTRKAKAKRSSSKAKAKRSSSKAKAKPKAKRNTTKK